MAIDLRLQQKMAQQLVMTPQLQQAIKLLQLSHLEMAAALRDELEQNPLLEERHEAYDKLEAPGDDDLQPTAALHQTEQHTDSADRETPEPSRQELDQDIDWEAYLESYNFALPQHNQDTNHEDSSLLLDSMLSKPVSLSEHLSWQVQMAHLSVAQKQIAYMLVDEINDDGYLQTDAVPSIADELGCSTDAVQDVLHVVQEFDPCGVAARNLQESLKIQARCLSHENPLVSAIIDSYLPQVEQRNLVAIAKGLKAPLADITQAVRLITQLEPRPGRNFSDREPHYITPDIFVLKIGDKYVISLNEDGLPRLRISNYYRNAMLHAETATKTYIQEKMRSAAWLIRSIHMRQRTIYRVMESILKFQREFFDEGVAKLKPLILRDVAEDVGMHESTISRVTTNKYVHTPQGMYELKFFFNSSITQLNGQHVASESVRNLIGRLIQEENMQAPLSDQHLVDILAQSNIYIARRTVAKYRTLLKIPSSSRRKRVF